MLGDGVTLASSAGDERICLWDTNTERLLRTMHGRWGGLARGLAVLGDGQTLAACSGQVVKLLNTRTGKLMKRLHGHSDSVRALTVLEDGVTLVSGSSDETVIFFDCRYL